MGYVLEYRVGYRVDRALKAVQKLQREYPGKLALEDRDGVLFIVADGQAETEEELEAWKKFVNSAL